MAAPNTFAGAALDRAGPRRGDGAWLAARLADPATRVVLADEQGVLVDGDEPRLVAPDELPAGAEPILLGVDRDGRALFAADPGAAFPGERRGLRDLVPALSQADSGLLAHAVALLNWHRRHRFCANCGAPTVVREAGHVRACPSCGADHHPRTDPVVIMLVADGDRVLLGRQARWPEGRYSALAGFVEPGESLEEAVAREVREEAGVEVTDIAYRSSQPWPFPASLMLGFSARWAGGEPVARDGELEDVRWWSREEIREGAGGLRLPPRDAIARRLLDEWLAQEAPDDADGSAG
ncbi:MAG: diphosphatase [Solirubrobacteraceae bacterium]|jgi:NAD+ diphosphatase|nr:diphosphatase [Solirubrobacteraceae bacterium]